MISACRTVSDATGRKSRPAFRSEFRVYAVNRAECAGPPEARIRRLYAPLTPALSPSDGEREKDARAFVSSLNGDAYEFLRSSSLYPSDGERVGERGFSVCIVPPGIRTPNGGRARMCLPVPVALSFPTP